jgi:hypothetical protein
MDISSSIDLSKDENNNDIIVSKFEPNGIYYDNGDGIYQVIGFQKNIENTSSYKITLSKGKELKTYDTEIHNL